MLTRATHLLLSEKRLFSIQSLERPGGKLFIVNCKIRIFLYLCVCMLKYVHWGGYLCKSMYMCMETILETGSLTGIWGPPPKLGQFTRKLLGSTLPLHNQHWNYKRTPPYHGFWEWNSCLLNRHFTNWAILSASWNPYLNGNCPCTKLFLQANNHNFPSYWVILLT